MQPEAAVALRDVDHEEPERPGALEQLGHHAFALCLDLGEPRENLVADEVLGRLGVEEVLLGEVRSRELRGGGDRRDEPVTADRCAHARAPSPR